MKKRIYLLAIISLMAGKMFAQPIPVEVVQETDGSFNIYRGGEPYYIYGAAGTNKAFFPELRERGGNSIRTWGVDALTRTLLNEAHDNGLTVMLGLWMKKERDGCDYNDDSKVAQQLESFRNYVLSFKDHPALLAWSIGNEVEVGATNLKVWNAVNDISEMIHEEDGNHPTLTITAEISTSKANEIAQRAPDLDLLGINSYGGISGVHSKVASSSWKKPYLITEWGVNGPWESGKTSWGAPREKNSSEKAELFLSRYQDHIASHADILPGSYAFYWNSKFEATQTWFGLWVGTYTTAMIDALQFSWTGSWAENRAPWIGHVQINGDNQDKNVLIRTDQNNLITVEASDPEGDPLDYEFLVLPESGNYLVESVPGATFPCIPGIVHNLTDSTAQLVLQEKHNHLDLRLYVLVRDGQGHIATATFPFQTNFSVSTNDLNREVGQSKGSWKVWPNPANEYFYIENGFSKDPWSAVLYNASGQVVFQTGTCNNITNYFVSLPFLPAGIYVLQLNEENGKMRRQELIIL